jgi:hypothetical protein
MTYKDAFIMKEVKELKLIFPIQNTKIALSLPSKN